MRPAARISAALLLSGCAMSSAPETGPVTASASAEVSSGRLVVDLLDGTDLEEAREQTGLQLEWATPFSSDEGLTVVDVSDLEVAEARMDAHPLVEASEPSLEYTALGFPDDPMWSAQWNMRKIGAPAGWRAGGGAGVTVAVIDTGVTKVEDLEDTVVLKGASLIPGHWSAEDDNGHGTHVAGTIAQSTNNGKGVAGVAPGARILPVKALTSLGMGRSEWIASAIDEAADRGAHVINMSLGGAESDVIRVAVEKALARGVVIVAAAGNDGREGVSSPARLPGVVAVSATGPDDQLAPYSSWGAEIALSAPGGDKRTEGGGILQDTVAPGSSESHAYRELQGTSMATPHVAGAVAVMLGAGASPDQAIEALQGAAVDLGPAGHDAKYGHGRLDVGTAVRGFVLQNNGVVFGIALAVGWLLAALGGLRPRRLQLQVALASAVTAGGIFVLPMIPVPAGLVTDLLARPLLLWPGLVFDARWASFPLWLSAGLPVVATFVLGPTRTLGWLVAGVSAGIGVHLAWGAATGGLSPMLLPGAAGTGWLAINAALALLCAMACVGVAKMRLREES